MLYNCIMKVNLFFNHYQSDLRQHEIDKCFQKNREVFDRVIKVSGRPTFKQLFNLTKDFPNDINVFCNSDIYFKEIESLKGIKENECFALTRWNQNGTKLEFFNKKDSQEKRLAQIFEELTEW